MDDIDEHKPHPWERFINARWRVILWLQEEMGYDDERIAKKLSMDEKQVNLIRNTYCFVSGCRNLETRCKDCGRLVCSKCMEEKK